MAKDLEANKQVMRDFLTALGKGDQAGLRAVIDPSIRAIATGTCSLSGTRDFDEVISAAGMLGQVTKEGIDFRIVSMTAEDDRVSAEAEGRSVLVNDAPYNNSYHFLGTVRGGKLVELKEYFCTKLADETVGALAAAGQAA